jgi:hypothetical protein
MDLHRQLALRDSEEAAVVGGLAAAVAAVGVVLADVPDSMEPVGVAVGTWVVFLGLVAALALARE